MQDKLFIRELQAADVHNFIKTMQNSIDVHKEWVNPPKSIGEFNNYLAKFTDDKNYCFLMFSELSPNKILGVVNVTQIVRGVFQNAFLSYYVTNFGYRQKIMTQGLQLAMDKCFNELKLHRLEANIQPDNYSSIKLIERVGFALEGYSKDYLFINGKWRDHKRYALLNNGLS